MIIPVDFETYGILDRPVYPPEPVGVAVKWKGRWKYLAWGHPTENNSTFSEAKAVLKDIWTNHTPVFHNAAFDLEVSRKFFKLPYPKTFHDTLFLAYLYDPREQALGLKNMAEKYLNIPNTEQESLKIWILKNVPGAHDHKGRKVKHPEMYWASLIHKAPGRLVGKYAVSDIRMTKGLFDFFYGYVSKAGMLPAYERDLNCLPIFEAMSSCGICVDVRSLKRDSQRWERKIQEWDDWIRDRLGVEDLDVNKRIALANAMDAKGLVSHWVETKKGNRSTSKENLLKVCTDADLVEVLSLRSILQTYVSTFAIPWLRVAEKHNGRIYPSFSQVRSEGRYGGSMGTRTGRPSSSNPNLLNIPRNQENEALPNMRDYLIPDPGGVFLIRDYSQQELRILAHFEEGDLFNAYKECPTIDAHDLTRDLIYAAVHIEYPRSKVKIVNFGVIYGMGKNAVADSIKGSLNEAISLLAAHTKALPGVKRLSDKIKTHVGKGYPIYTWGGREYYPEEEQLVEYDGRKMWKSYTYKLLNYLVQGSAADCTKEAMIRVHKGIKKLGGRIVLQVYDELIVWVPTKKINEGMKIVREGMESVEFDVLMLSDGKVGKKSWGQAVKFNDRRQ